MDTTREKRIKKARALVEGVLTEIAPFADVASCVVEGQLRAAFLILDEVANGWTIPEGDCENLLSQERK